MIPPEPGTVDGNPRCDPAGVDVFGALMGVSFAAAVLPQVSVAVDAFIGARAACYPAIEAINRRVGADEDVDDENNSKEHLQSYVIDSSSEEGTIPVSLIGNIEFRNVYHAYPARPDTDVFKDFNLRVEAGKTVALVGASGCGKSTAVSLL